MLISKIRDLCLKLNIQTKQCHLNQNALIPVRSCTRIKVLKLKTVSQTMTRRKELRLSIQTSLGIDPI